MPDLPVPVRRDPHIAYKAFLAPSTYQRNAQVNYPLPPGDLAAIAKTHFLIGFVLLKNDI